MSLRRFVTILIGIMLVFSCTDDLVQENNQGMPIRIVSGTKATTRAADNLNTEFANNTPINVAVDGRDYNYTTNGAGNQMTCTSATPPYFPIDGSSVKLQAYYPSSVHYDASSQNFTVAELQEADQNYKTSDLMYGEPSPNGTPSGWNGLDDNDKVMPTAEAVPLVFQHKLVKIKVNIVTNGASVSSVTLNNIKIRIPFNSSTGVLGSAVEVTNHTNVGMFSGSQTSDFTCTAIIPPQTIGTSPNFLTVITSIHNLTYKLPAEVTFVSGRQYIYNVTIFGSQISVTTNVTAWDESTATPVPGQGTLNRPKLPIEYIAPYNMATATSIATNNNALSSAYFCWNTSDAATPKDNIQKMINGTAVTGYHLPSKREWFSIISPYYGSGQDPDVQGENGVRIVYKRGIISSNLRERVSWGVINNNNSSTYSADNYSYVVEQEFYNDYYCPNEAYYQNKRIGYGLRFKESTGNGQYTCAYRYEYKEADSSVGGGASLTVQVIYVGANPNITIETISDDNWWTSPEYTVVLPASGYAPSTTYIDKDPIYYETATNKGAGFYWSAVPSSVSYIYRIGFHNVNIDSNGSAPPGYGFSVRLFKDARPKLPIQYVAEHNMYNATKMANNDYPSTSYFVLWSNALSSFDGHKSITNYSGTALSGKYHLPTVQEWMSISSPYFATASAANAAVDVDGADSKRITYENNVFTQTGLGETLQWGRRTDNTWVMPSTKFYNEYATNSSYISTVGGVTRKYGYAIRLKPRDIAGPDGYGEYTCAYRYTYTDKDPDCNNKPSLRVKVHYLGTFSSTTLSDITNEAYWSQAGETYYEVILPACGYAGGNQSAGASASETTRGYYWSNTERDGVNAFSMNFYEDAVYGDKWGNKTTGGCTVRLFRSE